MSDSAGGPEYSGAMGNREALLDAAIECIEQRGYARTTARDLAEASGTSLAAIGYHYGSKEALLNEAIAEGFRRWLARFAAVAFAEPDLPPGERLRATLRQLEASFADNRGLAVAFIEALAQAERSPEVKQGLAESYRQNRAALAAFIEEGVKPSSLDDMAVASAIIAAFDGLLIQWLLDPGETPTGTRVLAAIIDAASSEYWDAEG